MTPDPLAPRPVVMKAMPSELASLPATIPELLRLRSVRPNDPFVIGPGERLTFGDADRQSAVVAARLLAGGVGKGTRLGVLFPNGGAWVVAWLAAARIGALTVPLSTFAPGPELGRALRHADVQALVMGATSGGDSLTTRLEAGIPGLADSGPELSLRSVPFLRWVHIEDGPATSWSLELPPPVAASVVEEAECQVSPADLLVIVTTSGTTAAPKAVVHTQGSLIRHAAFLASRREMDERDRIYSPMPFFWVGGLTMVVLAALTSGAAAVVQQRFEPGEALDLIEKERVTQVSCWPNASRQLAEHRSFPHRDLSAVRGGTLLEALPLASRPSSPDLAPNVLGMTETGGPHTGADDPYLPLPEHLRGTIGCSLPGMEHLIVSRESGLPQPSGEEGELFVRGAFLMDGIYKRERHEVFTPDGWYATGDLGWFGADGHLRFTGRGGGMIKTGGSNVSPAEVESALRELPQVRAAYVFGVPAGDRGEDVAAVIVPTGPGPLDTDQLKSDARSLMSGFKVPRRIEVLEDADVPMLPTGKVDIAALRELFRSPRLDL
jgi:acyl-CoA synthetase (AMP-forming)/AMP-acid ligase II